MTFFTIIFPVEGGSPLFIWETVRFILIQVFFDIYLVQLFSQLTGGFPLFKRETIRFEQLFSHLKGGREGSSLCKWDTVRSMINKVYFTFILFIHFSILGGKCQVYDKHGKFYIHFLQLFSQFRGVLL